ncbi:hypothetical protein [Amycolatopsis japonica]
MARGLVRRVHVTDEQGRTHVFGPGSAVPEWAAEKITNPKAWNSEPVPMDDPGVPAEPPPVHGPGASRAKWAAYVAAHRPDVTVTDEMTQRDIVAACAEGTED